MEPQAAMDMPDRLPTAAAMRMGMVRSALNQLRWAAAGGLLLVGAAWAGTIYRATPEYRGPDPAQLQLLAGRLEGSQISAEAPLPDPPAVAAPRRPVAPTASRVVTVPAPPRPHTPAPVLPPAGPAPASAAPASPPAPPAPAESPVKSLALMGLTHRDQEDTAWLVDLNNMNRETAEVGERAFGFTVKEIGEDRVLLTRDGEEFELRLGEKSIPVPAGSQTVASADEGGFGDPSGSGGFGNRGFGRRNRGQGGFTGFSGFSGGSGRSFRSGYGGNRGSFGTSGTAPGLGSSSSYSGNSSYSGRSSGYGGNNRSYRASGGTGFSGGNYGSGRSYGSGGSSGMTSQFSASGTATATSNPQTARRRGSRLTGDTPALPAPQTITNPQTARRTGSSSGSAFGQSSPAGNTGGRATGSTFGGR